LSKRFYFVAHEIFLGLARTIYIRCIFENFGTEITKYTVYSYNYGQL